MMSDFHSHQLLTADEPHAHSSQLTVTQLAIKYIFGMDVQNFGVPNI